MLSPQRCHCYRQMPPRRERYVVRSISGRYTSFASDALHLIAIYEAASIKVEESAPSLDPSELPVEV